MTYVSIQYFDALSTIITVGGLIGGWSLYGTIYENIPKLDRKWEAQEKLEDSIEGRSFPAIAVFILTFACTLAELIGDNLREVAITVVYTAVFLLGIYITRGNVSMNRIIDGAYYVVGLQDIISSPQNSSVFLSLVLSIFAGFGLASLTAILYLSREVVLRSNSRYENLN